MGDNHTCFDRLSSNPTCLAFSAASSRARSPASSSLRARRPWPSSTLAHCPKLADIPDDHLSEVLPVLKKIVTASGAVDYNVLQNNGTIAHQEVPHVHFHLIPKPNEKDGLTIGWNSKQADMDKLKALCE